MTVRARSESDAQACTSYRETVNNWRPFVRRKHSLLIQGRRTDITCPTPTAATRLAVHQTYGESCCRLHGSRLPPRACQAARVIVQAVTDCLPTYSTSQFYLYRCNGVATPASWQWQACCPGTDVPSLDLALRRNSKRHRRQLHTTRISTPAGQNPKSVL